MDSKKELIDILMFLSKIEREKGKIEEILQYLL
jgi:hypothetical protein